MMRTCENTSVPPLKDGAGIWVLATEDKANFFADTFQRKNTLPPIQENDYSFIPVSSLQMTGFLPIRQRSAEHVLKHLNENS